MFIFHYFNYYLPDFVIAICLGFICGFSFLDICFNLTSCHNKPLVESSFLTRDQALSLWSRSTDSKTLDYQRTNPKEYQIKWELTKRKPLEYKTQHHPTTSSTLCRMPHLNNKKKQKTKKSAEISPYMKLTQTTGPTLEGQKPKGRKNSTLKPGKRRPQTQ